jgi:hypothetical protein
MAAVDEPAKQGKGEIKADAFERFPVPNYSNHRLSHDQRGEGFKNLGRDNSNRRRCRRQLAMLHQLRPARVRNPNTTARSAMCAISARS